MNTEALFSRVSDNWRTPRELVELLDREFEFDFDAAASEDSRIVGPYFGPDHEDPSFRDALSVDWPHVPGVSATVWLNPPYSQIADFLDKAYRESLRGATVVCLVPARTDPRWWWNNILKASEIRFLKGRLKFTLEITAAQSEYVKTSRYHLKTLQDVTGLPKLAIEAIQAGETTLFTSAPFPSAIAVYSPVKEAHGKPIVSFWDWKTDYATLRRVTDAFPANTPSLSAV